MNNYLVFINKIELKNELDEFIFKNLKERTTIKLEFIIKSKKLFKLIINYNKTNLEESINLKNELYDSYNINNELNCPFNTYLIENLNNSKIINNENQYIESILFVRNSFSKKFYYILQKFGEIMWNNKQNKMILSFKLLKYKWYKNRFIIINKILNKIYMKKYFKSLVCLNKFKIFIKIQYYFIYNKIKISNNLIMKSFFIFYYLNNLVTDNINFSFQKIKNKNKIEKFKCELNNVLSNENKLVNNDFFLNNFIQLNNFKSLCKSKPNKQINEFILTKKINLNNN